MSNAGRERATGCSLLVRNLSRTVRLEDLRYTAEKYGRLRDVYIPRDYYSGEARGIGFLEYTNARDAEDAMYGLDRKVLDGKEISVVLALQGRKMPADFRGGSSGGGRGYGGGSRRSGHGSPPRSSRRGRSRTRSRSRDRGRDRGRRGRSPSYSQSRSPRRPARSPSRSASRGRSYTASRSPVKSSSPPRKALRSPPAELPTNERKGHSRDD